MTARLLVAAHLFDEEHLWYAAHLRVPDADPRAVDVVWKAEPTFEFGETEYLRWATLDEVKDIDPRAFSIEVD